MIVKNVEKKENGLAQITVELDKQEFEAAVNKVYLKNKNQINLPGFRKGKAPRKMIENAYGASIFYEEAIENEAFSAFLFAVKESKLETVGQPSLADANVTDDKGLELVFSVALYPEVTLNKYRGLEAEKPVVTVTDADVEDELDSVREKNSRLVTRDDRPSQMNDTVVIDFEGFVNGEAFEGGKAEKYNLVLGSGSFIPGFEEQLVGLNAGDEHEVSVKFPENYTDELAGKEAIFKIKLHEVKENVLPEADDEFAKDVSEFDTLAEYKNSLREKLLKEREEEAQTKYRQGILEALSDELEAEIPEAMFEEQLDKMVDDYAMRIQAQGLDLNTYLQMLGISMEEFRKSGRPNAENQVKVTLALRKVIELENIQVSDEEIEAEYNRLAEMYKVELEQVRNIIEREQMITDLKMMKAEKLVADSGVATEPKPVEETAEEKTAE